MKVKIKRHGIIQAIAQCNDCKWDAALDDLNDFQMQKLRYEIYSHVKKTGHRVTLETGSSTEYYLDKSL